jgi:hypothetical protein
MGLPVDERTGRGDPDHMNCAPRRSNELGKVLSLVESFRAAQGSRREFARRHGLHPSALSRILRVGDLPGSLLDELASFERLSRTHLEVIATAPEERRRELLDQVRAGQSTYRLRDRRETTSTAALPPDAPSVASPPEPDPRARELARALGATAEETRAFALELLAVLLQGSPGRVRASLEQFRARRPEAQRPEAQRPELQRPELQRPELQRS